MSLSIGTPGFGMVSAKPDPDIVMVCSFDQWKEAPAALSGFASMACAPMAVRKCPTSKPGLTPWSVNRSIWGNMRATELSFKGFILTLPRIRCCKKGRATCDGPCVEKPRSFRRPAHSMESVASEIAHDLRPHCV